MTKRKPVWIDSSAETYVVVCDLCGRHDIFLTYDGAKGFRSRHADTHKPTCSAPSCGEVSTRRGLCDRHYTAAHRARTKAVA